MVFVSSGQPWSQSVSFGSDAEASPGARPSVAGAAAVARRQPAVQLDLERLRSGEARRKEPTPTIRCRAGLKS